MRVAVPSGVRKKTALRVQRSVAVGYVGVGWGGWGSGDGGTECSETQKFGDHQGSWPQEGFTGWCCKR